MVEPSHATAILQQLVDQARSNPMVCRQDRHLIAGKKSGPDLSNIMSMSLDTLINFRLLEIKYRKD